MTARGALIKPWIFREATEGYWDISADERLRLYRRYVELATAHWRAPRPSADDANPSVPLDEYGRQRLREFLRWHVGFWVRYAPQRPDGSWPTMQGREPAFEPRSAIEALLARTDAAAIDYITEELLNGGALDTPPAPGEPAVETAADTEG
jgi:tRNA-dihydrouridine synthase 3